MGKADLEQAFHRVEQGRIRNGEMAIAYLLSDVNPGDGGFCIPGSHKANFFCSWKCAAWKWAPNLCVGCRLRPVVSSLRKLTHGALPWTAAHQRHCGYALRPGHHGLYASSTQKPWLTYPRSLRARSATQTALVSRARIFPPS